MIQVFFIYLKQRRNQTMLKHSVTCSVAKILSFRPAAFVLKSLRDWSRNQAPTDDIAHKIKVYFIMVTITAWLLRNTGNIQLPWWLRWSIALRQVHWPLSLHVWSQCLRCMRTEFPPVWEADHQNCRTAHLVLPIWALQQHTLISYDYCVQ